MFIARRPKSETRHVLEWQDRGVRSVCGYVELGLPFGKGERPVRHGGKRGCGHCAKRLIRYLEELRGEA